MPVKRSFLRCVCIESSNIWRFFAQSTSQQIIICRELFHKFKYSSEIKLKSAACLERQLKTKTKNLSRGRFLG